MKLEAVYKIRRKSDGKFSSGGTTPRWTRTGKTWSCIGHLHGHLTLVGDQGRYVSNDEKAAERAKNLQATYGDCEIVKYSVSTTEAGTEPIQ